MNRPPKPSVTTHGGVVTRRWTEQRWLIDNVIRSVGVDWDQPRTVSYNAPCGPEANADFAAIREKVRKYADIGPAFEATARRREAKAKAAEEEGALVTARQNYFNGRYRAWTGSKKGASRCAGTAGSRAASRC